MQTVEEVGRRVSSILNPDELFPYVAEAIQQNFGYYHVDIFLVEPATGCAVFKASSDPAAEKVWKEQGLCFKIGEEGMIGWVAHTGEPLLANDVSQEPLYLPDELLPETRSELVVPLKVEERVVGVLDVDSDELNAFDEDDLFVLQTLANQIAIAVENARLYEETKRRAEEMTALHETALDITAQLEMQRLLNAIITRASDLLGATGGLVHLYDPARERLVAVTSHNLERDYTGLTLEVGEGAAGKVFQTGQPLIIDDHCTWAGKSPQVEEAFARSMLGVPLRWQEQIIGVLDIVDNVRVRAFDERDLGLLTLFANQAAIAI
ncbi:MAG: GAF domain-containing protein, partial [Anaerolineae bacterium]|nr:GAF domain-containing protein [Anaerolineae bacterium]